MASLVSSSKKLPASSAIAHVLHVFGTGASSGASPKILASTSGVSLRLVPTRALARAPTSAWAKLSALRSNFCCSGSSPSPLVVEACNGRVDGEREILPDLWSKMGIVKVAFIPYTSAGDPDLLSTAQGLKILDTCGSVLELGVPYSDCLADGPVIQAAATQSLPRCCNFDAITFMSKVVPQLSFPLTLLKLGVEKFMSILNTAGVRGQRPPRVHGVFISYKQEDTLHFVSHLKSALDRRGIKTFTDITLEGGVEVHPAIEEAIEQSEIAVVIVSQNYHLSPWCLIELEKILQCQRKWGLIVLPILRGMDAKDLREQPRHFVENIGQGEKGFKQEQPHQFQKYRDALRALGRIKALPVLCSSVIPEATVIEDAADQIAARVSRSA